MNQSSPLAYQRTNREAPSGSQSRAFDIFRSSQTEDGPAPAEFTEEQQLLHRFYHSFKEYSTNPNTLDILSDLIARSSDTSILTPAKHPIEDIVKVVYGEIQRLLDLGTGSVSWTITAWDDGNGGTEVYEAASERLEHILDGKVTAEMRQLFLKLVHSHLGPKLTRNPLNAFPCVFGMPELGYRPWLPPRHPDMRQERLVARDWIRSIAGWQMVYLDWDALKSDFQAGHHLLISRSRLPAGLLAFIDVDQQPVRQLALLLEYHRGWQRELLRGNPAAVNHLFQFTLPGRPDEFQTEASPDCMLTYPHESAVYLSAFKKHGFEPDVYMPNSIKSPPLFTAAAVELLARGFSAPIYEEIRGLLEEFQTLRPKMFTGSANDPLLHSLAPNNALDLEEALGNPSMPRPFFMFDDPEADQYMLLPYIKWIISKNGIIDSATGMLYGGYKGAAGAFVMGARARWTIDYIQVTPALRDNENCLTYQVDGPRLIDELFSYLKVELRKGIDASMAQPEPKLPAGTATTAWHPNRVNWRTSTGASGSSSPDDYTFSAADQRRLFPNADDSDEEELFLDTFSAQDIAPKSPVGKLRPLAPAGAKPSQPSRDPRTLRALSKTDEVRPIPLPTVESSHGAQESARRSSSETRPEDMPHINTLGISLVALPETPSSRQPTPQDAIPPPVAQPDSPPSDDRAGDSAMVLDGPIETSTPVPDRGRLTRAERAASILSKLTPEHGMAASSAFAKRTGSVTEASMPRHHTRSVTTPARAVLSAQSESTGGSRTAPMTRSSRAGTAETAPGPSRPMSDAPSRGSTKERSPSSRSGKQPINYLQLANQITTTAGEPAGSSSVVLVRPERHVKKKGDQGGKRSREPDAADSIARKKTPRSTSRGPEAT